MQNHNAFKTLFTISIAGLTLAVAGCASNSGGSGYGTLNTANSGLASAEQSAQTGQQAIQAGTTGATETARQANTAVTSAATNTANQANAAVSSAVTETTNQANAAVTGATNQANAAVSGVTNQANAAVSGVTNQANAAAASGTAAASGMTNMAGAATGQMGLGNVLAQQLGVSQQQALGGAGAIFQAAQGNMDAQSFSTLSQSIPGMDQMLGAAPQVSSPLGGSGLSSMLGGGNNALSSGASLAASFQQLNMSPDMVGQFIPIVTDYVQQTGGQATANLLRSALSGL